MLLIERKVDLFPYNTFHINATGQYLVRIRDVQELLELLNKDLFRNNKHFILGGGSNILLTSDFQGLVIKNEIMGIATIQENEDHVVLEVGAGENWHELVMYCVARDWGGIENLSLIPGTAGAAPMQNIGAYGVEIKNVIVSVEAIRLSNGEVTIFHNDQCSFGYRESIFKHEVKDQYFISSITLKLTKRNHRLNTSYGAIRDVLKQQGIETPTVKTVSDAVIAIRRSKLPDPAVIGNAGSFFKNPSIDAGIHDLLKKKYPSLPSFQGEKGLIKIPAAWLIEQCGWKGKTFNNIGVHKDQALVLVNYGGGKGDDIWNLAMDIRADVNEKFGILLQPEVNMIR